MAVAFLQEGDLCAYHHHRGVHAGRLALRGRAPDGLIYELGVGRFRSGDVMVHGPVFLGRRAQRKA
jgi:hypothetical protein